MPKSSLVIRPHSAQAWGRLGPKTTESKWVSGSTPNPGMRSTCSPHVTLAGSSAGNHQPVRSPACSGSSHLPAPAVTLSITCPPSPSLYLFLLCLTSVFTPLWDFFSLPPMKLPVLVTCLLDSPHGSSSSSVSLPQSLCEPQFPSPPG